MVQAHPEALKNERVTQVTLFCFCPLRYKSDTKSWVWRSFERLCNHYIFSNIAEDCILLLTTRRQIVFFFLGGFQKKSQTIPKAEIEKTLMRKMVSEISISFLNPYMVFSCSLVNSLLIARNFHIFTSEIFIENQQVTF